MKSNRQVTVKETSGVGWSRYWKPARGLRWLPAPYWMDGVQYVAYRATAERVNLYFYSDCFVCGGQFLTARLHTQYCSNRCAKHESRKHVNSEN